MASPPHGPPGAAAVVLHTRYTTQDAPRSRRFAAWQAAMGELVDTRPVDPDAPFSGAMSAYAVPLGGAAGGYVVFNDCTSSAIELDRGRSRLASQDVPHFVFQLFDRGGAGIQRVGRHETHAPDGGLLALDMRQPFHIRRGAYRALALFVPCAVVEARLGDAAPLHGRIVARETPAASLALDYLRLLTLRAASLDTATWQRAITAALELVAAALVPQQDLGPDAAQARRSLMRARACRYIDAHMADPELTADALARHLSVSRSVLYRLFEADGGVFAYVRARRLHHALLALREPDGRSITEIAHDHGFGNASDFTRAFRRRYGGTPSEWRQPALTAGARRAASRFPYAGMMRPLR